jgi:GAF domain
MTEDGEDLARVARIMASLAVSEDGTEQSLCRASARVTGVSGAGVVLILHGRVLGNVCSSDPLTEAVEEVQFNLGEGPCVDAFRTRAAVLVPDLAGPEGDRWPGFREGALTAGIGAVFGFPILIGPVCIGALDLFNERAGALTPEQHDDAIVVARLAGRTVLGWQSVAGVGSLARQLEHVPAHRAVVHQATGMVSVQADLAIEDALILLRAYSFAEGRPISAVATDVVGGLLRFD